MHLSIVIPAYNEQTKIARDLRAASDYLSHRPYDSQVIIVNDGSRDDTVKIIEEFIRTHTTARVWFRLISYPRNRGKGYAVRRGILEATGQSVGFIDAGLCVPYYYLEEGLKKLEEGFDYAIASRRLSRTKVHVTQPFHRRAGSKVFWVVVRFLMGIDFVSDTQCGFKLYRAASARKIFSKVQTDGFMFDIEALLIAKSLGLRGVEFPIEWSNDRDTRYHPVLGTLRNCKELMGIRMRLLGSNAAHVTSTSEHEAE